jgi:hypothetical protein
MTKKNTPSVGLASQLSTVMNMVTTSGNK